MIEIKFNRQQIAGWEKIGYARVLREVINQILLFNKGTRLFKGAVCIEIKIIFK